MSRNTSLIGLLFLLLSSLSPAAWAAGAAVVQDAIWGDGELYGTVVTPTTFSSPPLHSTDIIYNFSMSGLAGQRSVAESVPGDRDFNGGRWNVHMVVFTQSGLDVHDPDVDGVVNFELTSAEEVLEHEALGHLTITHADFYFECPLLPSR